MWRAWISFKVGPGGGHKYKDKPKRTQKKPETKRVEFKGKYVSSFSRNLYERGGNEYNLSHSWKYVHGNADKQMRNINSKCII